MGMMMVTIVHLTGCGTSAADAKRGHTIARMECGGCHNIEAPANDTRAPHLAGVIDRPAGMAPGYGYSPGMESARRYQGVVWTVETINAFLRDPNRIVPQTRMARMMVSPQDEIDPFKRIRNQRFEPLVKERDRRDVIAYLQTLSTTEPDVEDR